MIAIHLISEAVPVILLSDTGQKAMSCMDVFGISHLPVVKDNVYIGLISDRIIEDLNLSELVLESRTGLLPSHHVHPNQHIYEVASILFKQGLSLIPVVDDDHLYIGCITLNDLTKHLAKMLSVSEPGGVIVLQTAGHSYSTSQITQIVESNDARILSLAVSKPEDADNLEITLKLDKVDLSSVIQTFTRYGYQIAAVYMDDSMLHGLYEDRVDLLIKYMNI